VIFIEKYKTMKERKNKRVTIRLTEGQLDRLVDYIISEGNSKLTMSDVLREAVAGKLKKSNQND
jgi:GH24 family phage-related lysozyme (muramidase)